MTSTRRDATLLSPQVPKAEEFQSAETAVDRLQLLYDLATDYLATRFADTMRDGPTQQHYRAYYPEIRITTTSFLQADSRLSFGYVAGPGHYSTTVTRPDLFRSYLIQQITLLLILHAFLTGLKMQCAQVLALLLHH